MKRGLRWKMTANFPKNKKDVDLFMYTKNVKIEKDVDEKYKFHQK